MPDATPVDDSPARDAIPFDPDRPESLDAAVDRLMAAVGPAVEVLGFGEALHGDSGVIRLRNRLFRRLAEAHGFSAVAIESSFTRGRLVDDFVAGRGSATFDEVMDAGFKPGFGALEANRELVEWLRAYNADPARPIALRFYGFDSPTEMMYAESPRRALAFVLDYLAAADPATADANRNRLAPLFGDDAAWENPAAAMDPSQSVGRSPAAAALRVATEDLLADLLIDRPVLAAATGIDRHREAVHYAITARNLLTYHAIFAQTSDERIARCLGLRDAWMADNLAYIVGRERGRGRVLAFAHNSHLQRGPVRWQLGPHALVWLPAGAHLDTLLGPRYAVVGTAVGASADHGIAPPEPGTLEAHLTAAPGPARVVPTHRGMELRAADLAALPPRSGSPRNSSYFPLTPQSLSDFDWLAVLDSA